MRRPRNDGPKVWHNPDLDLPQNRPAPVNATERANAGHPLGRDASPNGDALRNGNAPPNGSSRNLPAGNGTTNSGGGARNGDGARNGSAGRNSGGGRGGGGGNNRSGNNRSGNNRSGNNRSGNNRGGNERSSGNERSGSRGRRRRGGNPPVATVPQILVASRPRGEFADRSRVDAPEEPVAIAQPQKEVTPLLDAPIKHSGHREDASSPDALGPDALGPVVRRRDRSTGGRVVLAPLRSADAKTLEQERLLDRLLRAESRPMITRAATNYRAAGCEFPKNQDVQLQLLEHQDEAHVLSAIIALGDLLTEEPPKRRAVLESRLRRIEEFAEDSQTQLAARRLRRRVSGRPEDDAESPLPGPVLSIEDPSSAEPKSDTFEESATS